MSQQDGQLPEDRDGTEDTEEVSGTSPSAGEAGEPEASDAGAPRAGTAAESPTKAEGPPEEDGGMSAGIKVALGCGGCLLVVLVVLGITVGAGGLWLTDRAEDFTESVEQQAESQTEATAILRRLEREHSFEPPPDGTVSPGRARRFFRVTDSAWEEMQGWSAELEEMERKFEDRDPGLSDIGAVFHGYGRVAESRVVLARSLDEQEMSLTEYLWTGLTLSRAYEAMEAEGGEPELPEPTRRVVRQNRTAVAELTADRDDQIGKEVVFHLAWVWGSADASSFRALGLDTLVRER